MTAAFRRLAPKAATALACAAATCLLGSLALAQGAPKVDASAAPAAPASGLAPQNSTLNLPDMGSGANVLISRTDEYQVGRMMMKNLRDENAVIEDPEATEYMQSLGSRIGAQAQDGTQRFTFFVVKDRGINAFAIPGGFIGVNYGLILLTNTESELAGVLGHEIGHVVQRHIARAIQAQSRQTLPMMAAMLGAILIGAAGGGDGAIGLMAMAQGVAMQQQINFTRMEEAEADRVGIGFLYAADFDPNGVASFWTTVIQSEGQQDEYFRIPDVLKSHPVNSLRIGEARARAAQFPPRASRKDPPSYALIRERLRVITASPEEDLRPYYAKLKTNGLNSLALQYGGALAALRAGDAGGAAQTLRRLVDANPGVTILHSALGEAQMAAGDQDGALKTFAHAIELSPRNVPVSVRYAETLMKAGRAEQAHQLLLDLFNNETPTPEQVRLTALAASAAGDTGDAYYYMAEFHLASGDLMLATQQLDLALAEPRLTDVQRKRFVARRDEIRDFLREQRLQRVRPGGS